MLSATRTKAAVSSTPMLSPRTDSSSCPLLRRRCSSSSAATTMYVIFSRLIYHLNELNGTALTQYIAEMLLKLNERGTWSDPPPTDADKRARQDEEIFQTARLVKYGFAADLQGPPRLMFLVPAAGTSWR